MALSARLNLITDLPGIRVGHAHDARVATGVTVIVFDQGNVASGVTRGGAPGSRDTALLEPEMTVTGIDAVVLSGGSLFGLDAAGGVVSFLRGQGRGLMIGSVNVPIAVQAIAFDLLNGGDKDWGRMPPYWELGWQAAERATGGALRARHASAAATARPPRRSRAGSARPAPRRPRASPSAPLPWSMRSARATIGEGPHFWAAACEVGGGVRRLGLPRTLPPDAPGAAHQGRRAPLDDDRPSSPPTPPDQGASQAPRHDGR